jgi:hypothetical protein
MTNHADPESGAGVHEIVDDIERTREELGDTIDALAAKLDVKSQVKNTASRAKANVVESAGHAAGTAQQRWPEIAVVLATVVAAVIVWRRMS